MANPQVLSQLRDIHAPPIIGAWPFAIGWYLLALLVLLAMLWLVVTVRHRYLVKRPKRHALRLLQAYREQYDKDKNSQLASAQVSELLKRVALVYFARATVASLQGDAWVDFLNKTGYKVDFTPLRVPLLELPYQPPKEWDLTPLFLQARVWISQRRKPCLI